MNRSNPNTIKTSKTKGVKAMSEITYTMVGDYNLPNLKLPEQTEVTLGRWSQMRRTYLKEHHKILYYNLLTKGILNSHLAEVQQRASELEETLVKQMAQKAGLTEQMKAEDMMKWVRLMNNIRNSAQEIVKNQVIFAQSITTETTRTRACRFSVAMILSERYSALPRICPLQRKKSKTSMREIRTMRPVPNISRVFSTTITHSYL